MTRRRVHLVPESGAKPGIQVIFKGKYLNDYFSFHSIAKEKFETSATNLCRQILHGWIKEFRHAKTNKDSARQMNMLAALEIKKEDE